VQNINHSSPSGEALGSWDGSQRRYFLKDHLGSVRSTVDQNGNVDGYDDYYPFGLTMPGRSSNSANPNDAYKFTGYEQDDEAGLNLYHASARGYDPVLGRFLQIDPLADQFPEWTPYHYVHNNPLNLIDPTGMAACEEHDQNCPGLIEQITNFLIGYHMGENSGSDAEYISAYNEGLSDEAHNTVHAGIELTEQTSDAGTAIQVGGIVTGQPEVAAAGGAVEAGSNLANLGLKFVDATSFGGPTEAVTDQLKTVVVDATTTGGGQALVNSFVKTAPKGVNSVSHVSSRTNSITGRKGAFVANATVKGIKIAASTTAATLNKFVNYLFEY